MSQERQDKKEQFNAPQKKGGMGKMIGLLVVVAIAATAGYLLLGQGATESQASLKVVNGEVRIPLTQVDDGQAHFFDVATGQGDIKFFVVKSVDGVMRAAFDTCDVCYKAKKGYRQEGNQMVCNNCNMKFRTDMINEVKGGCNPAPLERRIEGGQLVISEKALLTGSWYFSG